MFTIRILYALRAALHDERGSIPEWLPQIMAVVVAVAVLIAVMGIAKNSIGGWINTIWQDIIGNI